MEQIAEKRNAYYKNLQEKHDGYMGALLRRLKQIIKTDGVEYAKLIVTLHRAEGDKMLSEGDFNLLDHFVNTPSLHV
jgi:hypothetical protein